MGRRSTEAVRNFLAAIYAITVTLVGGAALFYMAAVFHKVADSFKPPEPDVLKLLQGEWQ